MRRELRSSLIQSDDNVSHRLASHLPVMFTSRTLTNQPDLPFSQHTQRESSIEIHPRPPYQEAKVGHWLSQRRRPGRFGLLTRRLCRLHHLLHRRPRTCTGVALAIPSSIRDRFQRISTCIRICPIVTTAIVFLGGILSLSNIPRCTSC